METTKFEDTCDATLPTPFCPQSATYGMPISGTSRFYAYESVVKQVNWYSENCQKLNIWTPETGEKLPVLVYIHGGGYMTGGSTKLAYSGAAYAKRGFYGDYELTVSAEGKSVTKTVQLSKNRDNRIEVIL